MNTLVDFITHIKGIEYLIAISAIAVYIIFWELLKPKPFQTMVKALKEDMEFLKNRGFGYVIKTGAKVVAAPFIGLAYVMLLPLGFLFALTFSAIGGLLSLAGVSPTLGWRPMEAYFGGRKSKTEKTDKDGDKSGEKNE
jgi:hypothetical protein